MPDVLMHVIASPELYKIARCSAAKQLYCSQKGQISSEIVSALLQFGVGAVRLLKPLCCRLCC